MKIKMIRKDFPVPRRESAGAAGYDLRANIGNDVLVIEPRTHEVIKLGVAIQVPNGYVGDLHARSSMYFKNDLIIGNGLGVIDADFTGELAIKYYNPSTYKNIVIEDGDRVAQFVLRKIGTPELEVVDELEDTERGTGGFGSSGRK